MVSFQNFVLESFTIPVLPLIGFGHEFYYRSSLQMDTAAFTCIAHKQPYIQALMVWFHKWGEIRLLLRKIVPASPPRPALVLQLPLRQKLSLLLLKATTSELVH